MSLTFINVLLLTTALSLLASCGVDITSRLSDITISRSLDLDMFNEKTVMTVENIVQESKRTYTHVKFKVPIMKAKKECTYANVEISKEYKGDSFELGMIEKNSKEIDVGNYSFNNVYQDNYSSTTRSLSVSEEVLTYNMVITLRYLTRPDENTRFNRTVQAFAKKLGSSPSEEKEDDGRIISTSTLIKPAFFQFSGKIIEICKVENKN